MEIPQIPVGRAAPGEHMDRILSESPRILWDTVRYMAMHPEPIPEKDMRLCRDLAERACLQTPDTADFEKNQDAFVRGMQWGYGLSRCTGLGNTAMLFLSELDDQRDIRTKIQTLSQDVRDYAYRSHTAVWMAEDCYPLVDPIGTYPNLIRWGFMTSLYMVDIGERNRIIYRESEHEKRVAASYEARFAAIVDGEELRIEIEEIDVLNALAKDPALLRAEARAYKLEGLA